MNSRKLFLLLGLLLQFCIKWGPLPYYIVVRLIDVIVVGFSDLYRNGFFGFICGALIDVGVGHSNSICDWLLLIGWG